jgi:glutamyl-Q tRNA(Asp) synthetase
MDDLDTPRVVPGMADDILYTLDILGFHWDGTPVWQSRRGEAYAAALDELIRLGVVYPCGCSRGEIARIASAPHGSAEEVVYPGICRNGLPPGKTPRSQRIRVPDEEMVFTDGIAGHCHQRLVESCGDFVVRRADGFFAYHLATVVDDHDAGINQVVRGADLLSSTPRQLYLQRLLGMPAPAYYHLPLVTGPAGEKLSKRDCAVSLASGRNLRRDGGGLLLAALRFLGQSLPKLPPTAPAGEILAAAVAGFRPEAVPRQGGAFPLEGVRCENSGNQ